MSQWHAAPLHWGHGPAVFEVFTEPTCPFSVKTHHKLGDLLALVGEDRMTLKLRLHSQTWHLHSAVVTRCVIAASTLPDGRDKAWQVLKAVGDHRDEFVCEHHCAGSNLAVSPADVIARIERYSGLELASAFAIPDLDAEIKWHAKYSRQNGIHGSPTFMLNGVVQPAMGSGDDAADWADVIRAAVPH